MWDGIATTKGHPRWWTLVAFATALAVLAIVLHYTA
jgi:hypothetical protein